MSYELASYVMKLHNSRRFRVISHHANAMATKVNVL